MPRLSHLLTLTPLETWRLVRRRLPGGTRRPAWTVNELMASAKHNRGIRFAELLLRQEAIVTRVTGRPPMDFAGAHVVEIGCGPLAGFGPLAVFRGAARYDSAEPEFDPALFHDPRVVTRYLTVMHAELTALYGPLMELSAFLKACAERLHIYPGGFDAAPIEGPVDIVLSQSVLEHVFPLDATLGRLAELVGPSTRMLHLVDFGNHYPTDNPFEGLYERPAAEYIAARGPAINLLRLPDIESGFHKAGIAARAIATQALPLTFIGKPHPWWLELYRPETLSARLALVVEG